MVEQRLLCRCALRHFSHIFLSRIQVLSSCRPRPSSSFPDLNLFEPKPKSQRTLTAGQLSSIMGSLGCTQQQAYTILRNHRALNELDGDRIQDAISACSKFGITREEILSYPNVMGILATTIEHHSMLLQEGGFSTIKAHTLVNYRPIITKRISLLKAYGYIPTKTNIVDSMISHLSPCEQMAEFPHTLEDSKTSFLDTTIMVLQHYLMWRLEADPKQIDAIFHTYKRLRHKSFRMMKRSLDLLENEFGFSKEKILKNGFLIHCNPDNVEEMIRGLDTLGGKPFKDIVKAYPKLLMTTLETLKKTAGHLEKFNIPQEAIQKCPDIFTLGSDTVFKRLSYLQMVPEFQALFRHPRILRLVYYQRKAKSRLDCLKKMRVKCASLHVLAATESLFEKYARDGADKTRGSDVAIYLSQNLHHNEQEIRSMLNRHPFWCHVPLVAVQDTLDYLLSKGFTTQHIISSIHIVLYPKSRVEKELTTLTSQPELSEQFLTPMLEGWTYAANRSLTSRPSSSSSSDSENSSSSSDEEHSSSSSSRSFFPTRDSPASTGANVDDPVDSKGVFCKNGRDLRLEFCVYFIEKEHHFTGNGIWLHPQAVEGNPSHNVPSSTNIEPIPDKSTLP